jgi:hypothetical protein
MPSDCYSPASPGCLPPPTGGDVLAWFNTYELAVSGAVGNLQDSIVGRHNEENRFFYPVYCDELMKLDMNIGIVIGCRAVELLE